MDPKTPDYLPGSGWQVLCGLTRIYGLPVVYAPAHGASIVELLVNEHNAFCSNRGTTCLEQGKNAAFVWQTAGVPCSLPHPRPRMQKLKSGFCAWGWHSGRQWILHSLSSPDGSRWCEKKRSLEVGNLLLCEDSDEQSMSLPYMIRWFIFDENFNTNIFFYTANQPHAPVSQPKVCTQTQSSVLINITC